MFKDKRVKKAEAMLDVLEEKYKEKYKNNYLSSFVGGMVTIILGVSVLEELNKELKK